MDWFQEYIKWNRLRVYPMGSSSHLIGEISCLEQGLINCLYNSKHHMAIRIDMSTNLGPVFWDLRAAMDVDYARYFTEKLDLITDNSVENLPEPLVICTSDFGQKNILYKELIKKNPSVLFWGSPDFSLKISKIGLKKKKLERAYEEAFKKIHQIREELEDLDNKNKEKLSIDSQIEGISLEATKLRKETTNLSELINQIKTELDIIQGSIQKIDKEIKVKGFWAKFIPNRNRLEKERKVREELTSYHLKEKELLIQLNEGQQQLEDNTNRLKSGEELENDLRKELSVLKKEFKAMGGKDLKYIHREEFEDDYRNDLPLVSREFEIERERLFQISKQILDFIYEECQIPLSKKDIFFAPIILISQHELMDFVKSYPRKGVQRVYLYGGNQISLEDNWEALGYFKEWISIEIRQSKDCPKNVHRFIEKDHSCLPFLKGEGKSAYKKLLNDSDFIFRKIQKKKPGFFEEFFGNKKGDIYALDIKSSSQREGLSLQPSHSKSMQQFLKNMLDHHGKSFFDKDFPLYILVPTESIKDEVIRDIRRSLFSHRSIREIRQLLINEEGLSGESLDILKQWTLSRVLTANEGRNLDISGKQILWILGGSFDVSIEEEEFKELFYRTLLFADSVALISEKNLWEENSLVYKILDM